jgi:hypothetical protein
VSPRRAWAAALAVLGVVAAVAAAAVVLATRADSPAPSAGEVRRGPADIARVRLRDVAAERGLVFRHAAFRYGPPVDPVAMIGGGVCWLDYDEDGWLDLFVVNTYAANERDEWLDAGGLPTSRLFRNDRGRFVDVTEESGAGLAVRGQGCVAADLDVDGHTDLFVTTAEFSALLWNEGDGTFAEGARAAGVDAFGWHTGAAAGDLNGDGRPELFLAGYVDLNNRVPDAVQGFPNTHLGTRDLLFLNEGRDGDGGRATFREVGREAGLEVGRFAYGLGALLSDLDRDGDLDLYVANDTNPNRLYENVPWPGGIEADPTRLGFRFEERAGAAGVADPNSGMGVGAADYDGDGRSDLFVTNARGQLHAAFRSLPPDENAPSWADARPDFGLETPGAATGWGVTWADLDLDSDLDLLLANGGIPVKDPGSDAQPLQALANRTAQGVGGRFKDVSSVVGLPAVGSRLARGSAAADFDNDGDVDVAVVAIGGELVLLENSGAGGNWLEVALEGFQPGAEVTAVLPDGRELRREVRAGSSYLSSEDPRLHFGLGAAMAVREVVVRWPGGEETRDTDVAANEVLVLEAPE